MSLSQLDAYCASQQDAHLAELIALLRIPTISTDQAYTDEIMQGAMWLHDKLQALGFDSQVHPTARHPIVSASYHVSPDKPTVLVYGHYDVQPPDPPELWDTPPFEPSLRGGKLFARGASDDKGQVYAHIKGAEAHLKTSGTLPVNLKFLIEGEEEIGSPNLADFMISHPELSAADVVIISDNAMIAPHTPTIIYGLKGLSYLEVSVTSSNRDLHSGIYGGGVLNPINVLARMIAGLTDDQGRVTVPGFYDEVLDLTPQERSAFHSVPLSAEAFLSDIAVSPEASAQAGEQDYTLFEKLWARPTLDCNGITGGFQGEGSKTVIPSHASAKISCRLVPHQCPSDITAKLSAHLRALAPDGVQVDISTHQGAKPAFTPLGTPLMAAAAQTLKTVYGNDTVFARTGGTIPVVITFQEQLGVPVILVAYGLDDDDIHAPNEKLDVLHYHNAIRASAALYQTLAQDTLY